MELEEGYPGGSGVGHRPASSHGISHPQLRLGALGENGASCAGQVSPVGLLLTHSALASGILLRGESEQEIGQEVPMCRCHSRLSASPSLPAPALSLVPHLKVGQARGAGPPHVGVTAHGDPGSKCAPLGNLPGTGRWSLSLLPFFLSLSLST